MSREHAYAYESGYQDGLRAAGTEKAALELRIDELCQDNERVKQQNAKLRELVWDMNECLEHSKPFCKKCKFQELDCQWFEFDGRMRELGIEVIP